MEPSCGVVPGTLCSLQKPQRNPFLTSFEHLKLSTNHHGPTIVTFQAAAETVVTFLLYRWHCVWGELGCAPCRIQRVIIGSGQGCGGGDGGGGIREPFGGSGGQLSPQIQPERLIGPERHLSSVGFSWYGWAAGGRGARERLQHC